MSKIDKELEKIRFSVYPGEYIISTHKEVYVAIPDEVIEQIKTVILEALKAEMPKEKSIDIPSQYGLKMTDKVEGYNQALSDCVEVINKLLGDSNE